MMIRRPTLVLDNGISPYEYKHEGVGMVLRIFATNQTITILDGETLTITGTPTEIASHVKCLNEYLAKRR